LGEACQAARADCAVNCEIVGSRAHLHVVVFRDRLCDVMDVFGRGNVSPFHHEVTCKHGGICQCLVMRGTD
jgi:hypothetical protein